MNITDGTEADFKTAIMETGFYPDEMPPCFRVTGFYKAVAGHCLFPNKTIVNRYPQNKGTKKFREERGWCNLATFNGTKIGGQRRIFSIPNPIFFIEVAHFLAQRRAEIENHLSQSSFSTSHLDMDASGKRLFESPFSSFSAKRREKLASYPVILKVDVTRFYPSIYTHAIPWALHGKTQAKDDLDPKSSNNWANHLDLIIRNSQSGQTIGIPVGPITSRLISEIIAVAIESEFRLGLDSSVDAVRHVDDIYFGVKDEFEAQKFLSHYREALAEFELEINETKLEVMKSKLDLEEVWPIKISRQQQKFRELEAKKWCRKEFEIFLDNVIRLANKTNNDSILIYCIKSLINEDKKDYRILDKFWSELEPFLFKVAANYSHPFKNVVRLVAIQNLRQPKMIKREGWLRICHTIIDRHAALGHDSEVSWACWLLKQFEEGITPLQFRTIMLRCGPFSALLAVDLQYHHNLGQRFETSLVKKRVAEKYMTGNSWILSYEAERLFEYQFKIKNRHHYKLYGTLMSAGVGFYDSSTFKDYSKIPSITGAY